MKNFCLILENLLNRIKQLQPSFTIFLGDFNATFNNWLLDDIASPECTHMNSYGFDQLISDPSGLGTFVFQ